MHLDAPLPDRFRALVLISDAVSASGRGRTAGRQGRYHAPWLATVAFLAMPHALSAQEGGTPTTQETYARFLTERTPISGLDMSSPKSTVSGFVEAAIRSNYFTAYFFLSPEAKQGFLDRGSEGELATLFPGYSEGALANARPLGGSGERQDQSADLRLDGARVFDDLMFSAEEAGLLPFTFGPGARVTNETLQDNGTARVVLARGSEPGLLPFQLNRMSNGQWRIIRIGEDGSRQRPWDVGPTPTK